MASPIVAAVLCCFVVSLAPAEPLTIGETFTLESKALGETRSINIYRPPGQVNASLPVLYMPDGGIGEDFLHIAGLVQVLVGNGTMRPFMLVGIENTERRRDMTGPTTIAEDKKIAPRVGGSADFRRFIRDELMPHIKARYLTNGETAIVGESLAGLFIVETFLLEPELFDTYIAFDPSLWWNEANLLKVANEKLRARGKKNNMLWLASSSEPELAALTKRFADVLAANQSATLRWRYEPMPSETHATIYHPAAVKGFREAFKPATP